MKAYGEHNVPGLLQLAITIKEKRAKAILQLHHGGSESLIGYISEKQMVSPSGIVASLYEDSTDDYVPRALEHEEILSTIRDFGRATEIAIRAGFDGVEIMEPRGTCFNIFFRIFKSANRYVGRDIRKADVLSVSCY